jgi:hypothetical protein
MANDIDVYTTSWEGKGFMPVIHAKKDVWKVEIGS